MLIQRQGIHIPFRAGEVKLPVNSGLCMLLKCKSLICTEKKAANCMLLAAFVLAYGGGCGPRFKLHP